MENTLPPRDEVYNLAVAINEVLAGKAHSLCMEALKLCGDDLGSISIVTLPSHQIH